ncbi:MAG: amidinotransferase [Flavobacterium sp.]|nr:amidinotransferase [Flavobacterium sp.]
MNSNNKDNQDIFPPSGARGLQTTNSIIMIRPVAFRMNEQTAINNYYQKVLDGLLPVTVNAKAQQEFDDFVSKLREVGIKVIVVDDRTETDTPDSIFPNNWISFHENGDVVLYPMFAENRRQERREDILDILEANGFIINEIMDYTEAEEDGYFLEGTGSVILDRENGKAYCALSPRADEELFIEFCEDFEFSPIIFEAFQTVNKERKLIYHTNVMMCIGETFAVICADCIDDKKERKMVLESLRADKKEIILITEAQVENFAGNMLELKGSDDKKYLIMSTSAHQSLTQKQLSQLEAHVAILSSSLDTIEACGGGSARCMMAEIFLPKEEE